MAAVPLLVSLSGWRGKPGVFPGLTFRQGAARGALSGVVYFGGTVYWTGAVVQTYGGLAGPVSLLVSLLLALYMAAYLAFASGLISAAVRRLGAAGLWLAPLLWVAGEFARGHVLGGFPWVPLGGAVVTLVPVAQLASAIGVYGVSFFLVAQAVLVARALAGTSRERAVFGAAAAALLVGVTTWGTWRVADGRLMREGTPLTIGLVQPNIAQADKWDPRMAAAIGRRYADLTRQVAAEGVDVVLWPESATPYLFNEDAVEADALRELVRTLGVPVLFGTDEIERGTPTRYFNSAMLLDRGGAVAAVYRKIQLVPFGEFVPLRGLLFFVKPLVDAVSDFAPGEQVTMLPVGEHMMSTAICYEVTYPHLARQAVANGAELLTTITNDGWYGDSSAPYQHFELAAMRAIEQGRFLARAANTGISGVIDPYGRVVAQTRVFEELAVAADARFLQSRTLYATIGDVVAHVSLVGTGLTMVWLIVSRPRRGTARRT